MIHFHSLTPKLPQLLSRLHYNIPVAFSVLHVALRVLYLSLLAVIFFPTDINFEGVGRNELKFSVWAALLLGCLSQSHLISVTVSPHGEEIQNNLSPWTQWTVSAAFQNVVHKPVKYRITIKQADVQRSAEVCVVILQLGAGCVWFNRGNCNKSMHIMQMEYAYMSCHLQ